MKSVKPEMTWWKEPSPSTRHRKLPGASWPRCAGGSGSPGGGRGPRTSSWLLWLHSVAPRLAVSTTPGDLQYIQNLRENKLRICIQARFQVTCVHTKVSDSVPWVIGEYNPISS
jgi:hypothetical protein